MTESPARLWLRQLESALSGEHDAEAWPALASLAGQDVELDDLEARAARRRAVLLLATGGDPRRGLELEGRAVTALAADLDEPGRRAALARGLEALRPHAAGLPLVHAGIERLIAEPELAWRAFACAVLAEELAED